MTSTYWSTYLPTFSAKSTVRAWDSAPWASGTTQPYPRPETKCFLNVCQRKQDVRHNLYAKDKSKIIQENEGQILIATSFKIIFMQQMPNIVQRIFQKPIRVTDIPGGFAIKLKTRLIKLPKLFSSSVFSFACKSVHVNCVSETYHGNADEEY